LVLFLLRHAAQFRWFPGLSSGSPLGGGGDDDLLPRTDISGPASASGIISGLGSANWKDRKAAMDEVEGLLVSAGNRIGPKVRGLQALGELAGMLWWFGTRDCRPG
jgi:hypothetical protein